MTRKALAEHIGELADAVLGDWRWVRDDLSVQVLGMLLYGYGLEIGLAAGLSVTDVDAAVLQCMTDHVGAATKWSAGLVESANASARDMEYHPAQHELIGVGRTYHGVADQQAIVDNVYANIASHRQYAGLPEPTVLVFLNPLVLLLAARERQKGSELTEAEVLEVRDGAACQRMPLSQAERFYAALDAQMPIPRLTPERVWDEWQAVRRSVV